MDPLPSPLSVAIVEDDAGLRASLAAMVNAAPDMSCVGTFASAEEAWNDLPSAHPQVVLMDINLPQASGVACVARLALTLPHTQFLMLTVYDDSDIIFDSLAAGACGYLRKPMTPETLQDAIREAHQGGAPMSSSIARRVIQAFRKPPSLPSIPAAPPPPTDPKDARLQKLAPRERQILEMLASGHLQKEIADQLGISFSTVKTLTARIYEKLHVHSRAQAVATYFGASISS